MTGATATPYRPVPKEPAAITPERTPTITNLHRCDQCGARAYFRFVEDDYSEWLFCGHHGAQHRDRFAHTIEFDERWQLDVKLDASA